MSKRDGHLLVADMLEALEKILEYTHGLSFEEYLTDHKTRDAVLRNLTVLGEAARQVPMISAVFTILSNGRKLHAQEISWCMSTSMLITR